MIELYQRCNNQFLRKAGYKTACTSHACYKNTYMTYIIILMGKILENMQSEIINGSHMCGEIFIFLHK